MKVKKFTAPSMPEAMQLIRNDLGSDAVILNSKEVEKGGILGLFSKRYLEVIAAVDPDASIELPIMKTLPGHDQPESRLADDIRRLENDIRQMKGGSTSHYPGLLREVYDMLLDQEITASLIEKMMRPLVKEWYQNDESLSRSTVYHSLYKLLKKELANKSASPFAYEKKYLLVAGPTGVGKTTTLAKIAAKAKLEDGKNIAFITADTYRIAAVDQLKAYADILNVPIEVAYTKEDFLKAKETFSDRDLVLVDTAGRNFREAFYIDELKQLIPFGNDTETWLVLSMTSKYLDLREIYRKFTELALNRCILTKIDETRTYGAAINFWLGDGMVPLFFTNGQNVPDDLIPSSPERVAEMITGVQENA